MEEPIKEVRVEEISKRFKRDSREIQDRFKTNSREIQERESSREL